MSKDNYDMELLEDRITNLEKRYDADIKTILDILVKLEKKLVGGGLDDSDEVGLISEFRDLKREMSENKDQLVLIKTNVTDISKSLFTEMSALKTQIDKLEKYRWLLYGGLIAAGWMISNFKSIIDILR